MKEKGKSNLSKILCTAGIILGLGLIFLVFSSEDNGTFLNVLPFLIFLLCPIMHIFMHKGHHHEDRHLEKDGRKNDQTLE